MHLHNDAVISALAKLLREAKRVKGLITFDFREGDGELNISVPDDELLIISDALEELTKALAQDGVQIDYDETHKRSH